MSEPARNTRHGGPEIAPPRKDGLCRWCLMPAGRGFCSQRCVDLYMIRVSNTHLRSQVFGRDKGVCSACSLDTTFLSMVLSRWRQKGVRKGLNRKLRALYRQAVEALGVKKRQTYWDADHVTPVSDGGGLCGLENLRTLCVWCHKNRRAPAREDGTLPPSGRDIVSQVIPALRARAEEITQKRPG